MSMRQAAHALGYLFRRPYVDFFTDIDLTYKRGAVSQRDAERIRTLLELNGLRECLADEE